MRDTTVRMDAFMTVSEMTILASQAFSPKGQGYCFHIRYNSEGIPVSILLCESLLKNVTNVKMC